MIRTPNLPHVRRTLYPVNPLPLCSQIVRTAEFTGLPGLILDKMEQPNLLKKSICNSEKFQKQEFSYENCFNPIICTSGTPPPPSFSLTTLVDIFLSMTCVLSFMNMSKIILKKTSQSVWREGGSRREGGGHGRVISTSIPVHLCDQTLLCMHGHDWCHFSGKGKTHLQPWGSINVKLDGGGHF